jgi:tetratricopeptide (TPR) repeat protein
MPKLEQVEIERAKRKPTESLDAFDYYLRGMASFHQTTNASISEALNLFYKAIELDPNYAVAYGMAARCYAWRKAGRWMTDPAKEIVEGERLARRAMEVGWDDAVALSLAGYALAFLVGDLEAGAAFINRALSLNPNIAVAWHFSGLVRQWIGEPEVALKHVARAMRLSPLDPLLFAWQSAMAFAHFFAGRYDEASLWAGIALQERPYSHQSLRIAAASNALAGRLEEAKKTMTRLRQIDPTLRISDLHGLPPLRRPEDLTRYEEGLRKAGLPE